MTRTVHGAIDFTLVERSADQVEQGQLVANDVQGVVIVGSGHWLMEEAPEQVIPQLVAFINAAPVAR